MHHDHVHASFDSLVIMTGRANLQRFSPSIHSPLDASMIYPQSFCSFTHPPSGVETLVGGSVEVGGGEERGRVWRPRLESGNTCLCVGVRNKVQGCWPAMVCVWGLRGSGGVRMREDLDERVETQAVGGRVEP